MSVALSEFIGKLDYLEMEEKKQKEADLQDSTALLLKLLNENPNLIDKLSEFASGGYDKKEGDEKKSYF